MILLNSNSNAQRLLFFIGGFHQQEVVCKNPGGTMVYKSANSRNSFSDMFCNVVFVFLCWIHYFCAHNSLGNKISRFYFQFIKLIANVCQTLFNLISLKQFIDKALTISTIKEHKLSQVIFETGKIICTIFFKGHFLCPFQKNQYIVT